MRANQFITEYRRDKTAQAMGDKLLNTLANTSSSATPDRLYNVQTLLAMARMPEKFPEKTISMEILGQQIKINPATAGQLVQQIKPRIIDVILAEIEAKDPTQNKQFTQWMSRAWAAANGSLSLEDLNKGNLLYTYESAKRAKLIPLEAADIGRFKSYKEFENWMITNQVDKRLSDATSMRELSQSNVTKLYADSNATLIVPNDEEAACKYGANTKWCTAATKSENYFNSYNKRGKIYIIIPKKPQHQGEKYQIHFEKGEFKNEKNQNVSAKFLLTERFPTIGKYFIQNNPDSMEYLIAFAPDNVLAKLAKRMSGVIETEVRREAQYNFKNDMDDEEGISLEAYEEMILEDFYHIMDSTPADIKEWADEFHISHISDLNILYQHIIFDNVGSSEAEVVGDYIARRYKVSKNTTTGEWSVTNLDRLR
jgi:hypothetical protein